MNSDPRTQTLADRLRFALGCESVNSLAVRCGLRESSIRQYLSGSMPGADKAALLASALGVTMEWLVTGEESAPALPQGPAQTPDPAAQQPLDPELYGRIVDGISKTYREIGARIQPVDLGRLAARMAAELMEIYDDPDDRLIGLKALLRRLRADLLAAPQADTTSSKRQA